MPTSIRWLGSESYYRFQGSEIETLKKIWLNPVRGFLSDEFYYMPGLGALYSRVSSYLCRLEQMRRGDGSSALRSS